MKLISRTVIIFTLTACGGNTTEKPADPNSKLRIEAMKEIHEKEQKLLTTYGVVDKEAGIYRIPIDRAMEVVAGEAN